MPADKARVRRWKRRIKAAASLVLAAAAGTFLACTRVDRGARKPSAAADSAPPKDLPRVQDAGSPIQDATVDREEHRKGMPVKDNLLE